MDLLRYPGLGKSKDRESGFHRIYELGDMTEETM
jgi:hypothetical protein